uniref:protein-tyrosine-phosphatase n=1 Tax=Globisporangium ultimum (strain ATCC 200006 / CBS 805.95 / DAOM BR144) TaxID=431595 RepID=K3WG24_GLOUD
MTVSTPIIAILPRAAAPMPVAALSAHRCHTQSCAPRRWEAVYDVVAQMVVLPVVCVSLVGVVGVMLGLECMETLQRRDLRQMRFSWATIVDALLRGYRTTTMLANTSGGNNKREHNSDGGKSVNQDRHQREHEDGRRQNTRPLKKQKSSADNADSSSNGGSNGYSGDSDGNASLETRPQAPNEACVRPKKTHALSPRKRRRVFIWDLDETLVLFASLYTGAFAQQHGKEIALGVRLGEQMMTFLLAMLERHFFFNDLHDADIDHIHCLEDPTRRRPEASRTTEADAGNGGADAPSQSGLLERYERIREIYEREGAVDFLSDERSEWFAIREALVASIDTFSTGWLREARQVLELLTTKKTTVAPSSRETDGDESVVEYENINLLVTNTQLAPALCKCLIYQLDAFFPIECVYSSSKLHKQHCFEQIMQQYDGVSGDDDKDASNRVEFIAIGDGAEEEHVSRALGISFHKIRSLADLKRLRFDLQLDAPAPSLSL